MSFWKESPGPHWSDAVWSLFICTGVPIAQPIRRYSLDKPSSSKYSLQIAKISDAADIVSFLEKHFVITKQSSCHLPVERLIKGIANDWIFIFAKYENQIVGTIASRSLGAVSFHINANKETYDRKVSTYPNSGYIDFFCVHPDHRKDGLGSLLLKSIDYSTNRIGRSIHFFAKELTPLLHVPPLWKGTYIWREITGNSRQSTKIQIRALLPKPKHIENEILISFTNNTPSQDTKYYTLNCGNFKVSLAIANTYHMYMNSWLGEVLFYRVESNSAEAPSKKNIGAAIEELLESASYRYILMDESIPHLPQMNWTQDASYYLYAYNVNPRKFFSVKPEFWF